MKFVTGGFYRSVVGIGRSSLERFGIGPSGPMDLRACRLNHMLLGNREDEMVLEMTGPMPTIAFDEAVSCAVTGKPVHILCDGYTIPMYRSFDVRPGSVLTFGRIGDGGWTYLGIGGGIEGITRDQIRLKAPTRNPWISFLPDYLCPSSAEDSPIGVVPGPEWDWFDSRAQRLFLSQRYGIASVDRMGYRLEGKPIHTRKPRELISSPVSTGIIQVTGSGQPIVLMAGRQTVGGYPRIAFVSLADLSRMTQTGQGETVRFQRIGIEEAERAWREETQRLAELAQILFNQRDRLLFSESVCIANRRFFVQITP